jgi:TetR/AcrR family transcriptional regulator, regulator of autoinduction and epiphytic fitness
MTTPDDTDPRIERSRRRVREAALVELAERGYGGFSIESVSRRSGVAKSTVYRHWPGRLALVADAFESLDVQPPGGPAGKHRGRARVLELLHHLAAAMRDSAFGGCLPALVEAAEHHPDARRFLHDFSARRRAALVEAIREAVAEGEARPDLDPEQAALALSGAVIYRRLMSDRACSGADVERLADTVLGV